MVAERPLYGGDFKLPGVKAGEKPVVVEIKDHYQIETLPYFHGTMAGGGPRQRRDLISGMDIAQDIIRQWTKAPLGCSESSRPGIWLVREVVHLYNGDGTPQLDAEGKPAFRDATPEEKAHMWKEDHEAAIAAQGTYADYCIADGNSRAEDPKQIKFLPEFYRALAKHYGHTPKWLNRISDNNVKTCPWCTQAAPANAAICPNCKKVIDPVRAAQLERDQAEASARSSKGIPTPPVKAA